MTELQILSAIRNNGGHMNYLDLMNLGITDPNWMPNADRQRIRQLIDSKVLSGKTEAYGSITFGEAGFLRYQDLILQQDAERKAQETAIEEQRRLKRELEAEQANKNTEQKRQRSFEILLVIISAAIANIDRIIDLFISLL